MELLAAIRPDSWNLPLLLHVLGAMVLVGATLACASALAFARGDTHLQRAGYYSLLVAGVPGWVAMFVGGEWIYRREGLADDPIESAWVLIGFLVAELGGALLLVSLVLGAIGLRRLHAGNGTRLLEATMVLSVVLLAANVIAAWAMSGKPD